MTTKRRRCAFTLIEVLVVVGIIALLVGILIPSLRRARHQGISVSCQSNVRQLCHGMMFYLHQYGAFPAHQWRLPDGGRIRWFTAMADLLSGYDVQGCPATPDWEVARNNSYGYNYKYLGSARENDFSPTVPWERFPVKSVKMPSRTIAFGDSDGTGWTKPHINGSKDPEMFGNHGYTLDPTFIPEFSLHTISGDHLEPYAWRDMAHGEIDYRSYISERHLGGSNLCFADGHVQRMRPKQVYVDNRYWNGLGGEDPVRDPHVPNRHTNSGPFRYEL